MLFYLASLLSSIGHSLSLTGFHLTTRRPYSLTKFYQFPKWSLSLSALQLLEFHCHCRVFRYQRIGLHWLKVVYCHQLAGLAPCFLVLVKASSQKNSQWNGSCGLQFNFAHRNSSKVREGLKLSSMLIFRFLSQFFSQNWRSVKTNLHSLCLVD